MAWDTSNLTPDVHRLLTEGKTVEEVADAFEVHPDAVRQHVRKLDAAGEQIGQNGDPAKTAERQRRKGR